MGAASSVQMEQGPIVPLGCQLCMIGARIKWWCNDCNLPICDRCKYKDHQIFGAEHDIVGGYNVRTSRQKTQAPVECQMCNTGARVQWLCRECNLILCDRCEFNEHQNFGMDHDIVNIRDKCILESRSYETEREKDGKKFKMKFEVIERYNVDMENIHFMAISTDNSLWFGGHNQDKLQHAQFSVGRMTVMSSFNIKLLDLAISPSGFLLVVEGSPPTLQIFNERKRETLEKLTIYPWGITCVHVSKDNKVIVGGNNGTGKRGIVIVLDNSGDRHAEYEKESDKSIFTYPKNIVTTSNGNIFVLDGSPHGMRGRIVVIKPGGGAIQYYHGHLSVNSEEKPFRPVSLLATPRDTIMIMDLNTSCLHLLNNGYFITCYNLKDIGINRPYAIALSRTGSLFVGTLSNSNHHDYTKATLYELEYYGF